MMCRAFPSFLGFNGEVVVRKLVVEPEPGAHEAETLCPSEWQVEMFGEEAQAVLKEKRDELKFFNEVVRDWNRAPGEFKDFLVFLRERYRERWNLE